MSVVEGSPTLIGTLANASTITMRSVRGSPAENEPHGMRNPEYPRVAGAKAAHPLGRPILACVCSYSSRKSRRICALIEILHQGLRQGWRREAYVVDRYPVDGTLCGVKEADLRDQLGP